MKNLLWLLSFAILISCNKNEPAEQHIPKQYSIDQFYKNTAISGGFFSPDGSKLLVSNNASGIYNAMAMPVDGGAPDTLTRSKNESIFVVSYFPADERILYQADRGGDEITHIYMRDVDGKVTDLTPGDSARAEFFGWAKDDQSFFYASNLRDMQYMDLYEMPLATMKPVMLYENTEGLDAVAISDNKEYLALTRSITTNNNEMYVYHLASKELKHLTPHQGDVLYNPQYFDKDNSGLLYLSDEEGEFQSLRRYNLTDGKKETLFAPEWDVWYAYESKKNKYRVVGVNANGSTEVYVTDLSTGKKVDFPVIESRNISGVSISPDETKMRLTAASSRFPNDLYVYNFSDGSYKQLTNTLNPDIDPRDLVAGEVVKYKSFDGTEIPAIYWRPLTATPETPCPAIVWVHGGPGGQTRATYFPLIQAMVNHGYAVLGVNNRGSSGYGKSFYKMDDRNHGEGDLQDCIYGKKYLQTLPYIDTANIGIAGGSYGGYMVMAALAFAPEEFDAGVNVFGVTNWLRTLKSIPPWWTSFREALYTELGDPNTLDSVRLHKISPLFHAQNVTKPLLVLQGANDPRVLQIESDEIVAKVKANNVPVDYVLFEDEGHGFVKKENEIEGYGKILQFLDLHLKKQEKVAN